MLSAFGGPMKRSFATALLYLVVLLVQSVPAGAAVQSSNCDRECLRGFITDYLNALITHTPQKLLLASSVRFTEDAKSLPLGEGLWKGASKLRSYRQDFLDVREGQAASHVILEENGAPIMLALRLKIVDKKITEIETMVTRNR